MTEHSPNSTPQAGRNRTRATSAALEAHYRFVLWLVPAVERFPRSQKFLLGDRLQTTALDVLERLIAATYTRQRVAHLTQANLGLEKLRFLCRIAYFPALIDAARCAATGERFKSAVSSFLAPATFPAKPCLVSRRKHLKGCTKVAYRSGLVVA